MDAEVVVVEMPLLRVLGAEWLWIVVDAADPLHVLVGLRNHALWHSTDGGTTWSALTGNWILSSDPAWKHDGNAVAHDPNLTQVYLVGTSQKGIWRTADAHGGKAT